MKIPTFVAPVLAWSVLPIALAGMGAAQSFIGPPSTTVIWGPRIHAWATTTYAVILLASGVINAVVVTTGARRLPWAVLSQGYVLLVAAGWLACILAGPENTRLEAVLGVVLAGASIGALFVALLTRTRTAVPLRPRRL